MDRRERQIRFRLPTARVPRNTARATSGQTSFDVLAPVFVIELHRFSSISPPRRVKGVPGVDCRGCSLGGLDYGCIRTVCAVAAASNLQTASLSLKQLIREPR